MCGVTPMSYQCICSNEAPSKFQSSVSLQSFNSSTKELETKPHDPVGSTLALWLAQSMPSGADNWSEVPLQLAKLLPDLIKAIKDTAFCQKYGIQKKL